MRLDYHSITWGGVVGHPTSVKNLSYRLSGSIDQTVWDIAAAGYEGIETASGSRRR